MNVLITGGASGLGGAITRKLAAAAPGSRIYFTYRSGKDAATALEAEHPNCSGIICDFAEPADLEKLAEFIAGNEIGILVNNALAQFRTGYAHKTLVAEISASFMANVIPAIRITQAFITAARKRKQGKIITILSAAIQSAPSGWSVYVAEKMYLLGMHQSWAKENIAYGITSNCVSPAFMLTPLHKDMDERLIEDMQLRHPLKKLLTTEEVADVVQFLATASSQLNGQNIVINP